MIIEFVYWVLKFDPKARPSCKDILRHKIFDCLKNKSDDKIKIKTNGEIKETTDEVEFKIQKSTNKLQEAKKYPSSNEITHSKVKVNQINLKTLIMDENTDISTKMKNFRNFEKLANFKAIAIKLKKKSLLNKNNQKKHMLKMMKQKEKTNIENKKFKSMIFDFSHFKNKKKNDIDSNIKVLNSCSNMKKFIFSLNCLGNDSNVHKLQNIPSIGNIPEEKSLKAFKDRSLSSLINN